MVPSIICSSCWFIFEKKYEMICSAVVMFLVVWVQAYFLLNCNTTPAEFRQLDCFIFYVELLNTGLICAEFSINFLLLLFTLSQVFYIMNDSPFT